MMDALLERHAISAFIREEKGLNTSPVDADGIMVVGSWLPIFGGRPPRQVFARFAPETIARGRSHCTRLPMPRAEPCRISNDAAPRHPRPLRPERGAHGLICSPDPTRAGPREVARRLIDQVLGGFVGEIDPGGRASFLLRICQVSLTRSRRSRTG